MANAKSPSPRSSARLAAVQALYQVEMSDDVKTPMLIEEYINHRLGQEIEGDQYGDADQALFSDLTDGALNRVEEIDAVITPCLSADWPLSRLEKVIRSILRVAGYEFIARPDVPTKVIINEYIEVAKAFYDRKEVSFINAVLDKMSQATRT